MKHIKKAFLLLSLIIVSGCTLFQEIFEPGDIVNLLKKDNIPPEVFVTSPTNWQEVGMTNQMTGTAGDLGSGVKTVIIQVDQNAPVSVQVVNQSWSTILVYPAYGVHTNTVYAEDNSGNMSQPVKVIIERTAIPSIVIASPAFNSRILTGLAVIDGTAFVDWPYSITQVQMNVNGGGWSNIAGLGSWSNTVTLTEGTNDIQVRALANSGKSNTSAVWKIVKYTLLSVNFVYPQNGIEISNNAVSGTSSVPAPYHIVKVQIQQNGGPWTDASGTTNWMLTVKFMLGQNTLKARAISDSGLTNETPVITNLNHSIKFLAYDGTNVDRFGYCVAISSNGNAFIVGAFSEDNEKGADAGSVYRFTWNGSYWVTNKFLAHDGALSNKFGGNLAMTPDGNTFIVGPDAYATATSGFVYRFHWNGSEWETNKFTAFDAQGGDSFGCSVAITPDGNTFVAGNMYDNDKGLKSGSVYRLHFDGTNWFTNKFVAYDGTSFAYFGISVAVSDDGNSILAGTINNCFYHFKWNGTGWSTNKFSMGSIAFGKKVAISADGDTIVAGACQDNEKGIQAGAVFIFRWSDPVWVTNKLIGSDTTAMDQFGFHVSVSPDADILTVGAPYKDSRIGAVYRFVWNGSIWEESKTVHGGFEYDDFGLSAGSTPNGGISVIGAHGDDEKGSYAGAVYLYHW